MAKLSAHGKEVGRINYTTYAKAYMQDGVILKNEGHGWKVYGKCKFTPQEVYENALDHYNKFLIARPCLAAYRDYLHDLAGMGKAWKLHAAVTMLGDDIDGIWSEACDGYVDNVRASVEEIKHLVDLYNQVRQEGSRHIAGLTACNNL